MEVSERPMRIKARFEDFYQQIDEQNFEIAQQILNELETILGDNDPELAECRVRLELEQM